MARCSSDGVLLEDCRDYAGDFFSPAFCARRNLLGACMVSHEAPRDMAKSEQCVVARAEMSNAMSVNGQLVPRPLSSTSKLGDPGFPCLACENLSGSFPSLAADLKHENDATRAFLTLTSLLECTLYTAYWALRVSSRTLSTSLSVRTR